MLHSVQTLALEFDRESISIAAVDRLSHETDPKSCISGDCLAMIHEFEAMSYCIICINCQISAILPKSSPQGTLSSSWRNEKLQ
jgi:hypothetical protein